MAEYLASEDQNMTRLVIILSKQHWHRKWHRYRYIIAIPTSPQHADTICFLTNTICHSTSKRHTSYRHHVIFFSIFFVKAIHTCALGTVLPHQCCSSHHYIIPDKQWNELLQELTGVLTRLIIQNGRRTVPCHQTVQQSCCTLTLDLFLRLFSGIWAKGKKKKKKIHKKSQMDRLPLA